MNFLSRIDRQAQISHSIFEVYSTENSDSLWIISTNIPDPFQFSLKQPNSQFLIYQGKLFQKQQKQKKWFAAHFELYSDRLIRITDKTEFLHISSCFIKRLKPNDTNFNNKFKFGIKFTKGQLKTEIFGEQAEQMNLWFEQLKRLCLLPKFNKRHKILQKIKAIDGTYYRCYKQISGQQFQVRQIDKQSLNDVQKKQLVQEIQLLRLVNSPYVVKLLEIYEEENMLYLLFENFLGKDIRNRLYDYALLQEKLLAETVYKLLLGLNSLHQKGIIHRDIRPENIILKNDNNLTDICISNLSCAELQNQIENQIPKKNVNNIGFQAPETFQTKIYDQKSDVFQLGVIFYWFAYSRSPFDGNNQKEVNKLNEKCQIVFEYPKSSQKNLSASAVDLIKLMLSKNPNNRITSFQAINHHWFINMRTKVFKLSKDIIGYNQIEKPAIIKLTIFINYLREIRKLGVVSIGKCRPSKILQLLEKIGKDKKLRMRNDLREQFSGFIIFQISIAEANEFDFITFKIAPRLSNLKKSCQIVIS